jgi:hypothetical protein
VRTFADIERETEHVSEAGADAARLLALAEEVLERWIGARGAAPTHDTREGFRLLALHRQGAQDLPSFNACRETCREIAYHYNLIAATDDASAVDAAARARHAGMMGLLVKHLLFFVSGKMQSEQLGEFCCASRPLRTQNQEAMT